MSERSQVDSVTHEHSVGTYLCPLRKDTWGCCQSVMGWTEMDAALGEIWGAGTVRESLDLLRGHLPVLPEPASLPAILAQPDVTLGWPGFPAYL